VSEATIEVPFSARSGATAKAQGRFIVPVVVKRAIIPRAKPKSPTRFTNIALIEALDAWRRVDQKLMRRYEATPTPSQPKKVCKRLSAVTRVNIKKVKMERYAINRGIWGS
jgi:predicted helicase